jgi:hypothetical protein
MSIGIPKGIGRREKMKSQHMVEVTGGSVAKNTPDEEGDERRRVAPGSGVRAATTPPTRAKGSVARGVLSGLVGGLCCIAGAAAVGLGLGGMSFFGTLMDRYQIYFLLASLALMGFWIVQMVMRSGFGSAGLRGVARAAARPVAVMGLTYAVTLIVALGASGRVRGS